MSERAIRHFMSKGQCLGKKEKERRKKSRGSRARGRHYNISQAINAVNMYRLISFTLINRALTLEVLTSKICDINRFKHGH